MAKSYQRKTITLETAQRLVTEAVKKAEEIGVPMAVAVCDAEGILKSFVRMDGAKLLAVRIAQQKAWSSVSFGFPTHGYYEFIKDDPPLLAGLPHQQDMIVFGGGYPVQEGDEVIGAIGISGGHYSQDQQCAEAALSTLG